MARIKNQSMPLWQMIDWILNFTIIFFFCSFVDWNSTNRSIIASREATEISTDAGDLD